MKLFAFILSLLALIAARVSAQNPYPTQNGIVVLDGDGKQIQFYAVPGQPLDVEPLLEQGFCVTTQDGQLIQYDVHGNVLSQSRVAVANDVDVAGVNQFLLTSRAQRRIEMLNIETNERTVLPASFVGPSDSDLLPNGNLLVCDAQAQKIVEITPSGEIVWEYRGELKQPMDAVRFRDGHTLISDFDNHRVIEIRPDGTLVQAHHGFNHPQKLYPRSEQKVLVADSDQQRVVKLNRNGEKFIVQSQLNYVVAAAFFSELQVYLCAVHNRFSPPENPSAPVAAVTSVQKTSTFWFLNRYSAYSLALLLGVLLWFMKSTGEWTSLLVVMFYTLLLGIGYVCVTEAASGYPYQPGGLFYIVVLSLAVSVYLDVRKVYLPKEHWISGNDAIRFPYSKRALCMLIGVPLLGLALQFDYSQGIEHFWQSTFFTHAPEWVQNTLQSGGKWVRGTVPRTPWYLPMWGWGVSIYLLFRVYLFQERGDQEQRPPFTTGSVSDSREGENVAFYSRYEDHSEWKTYSMPVGIAAVVLAVLLYTVGATGVPYDVHGDEAEVVLHGIEARDSGSPNIFNLSWYLIPNLFFLYPAWVMWLVGDGLFGLRLAGALAGVASTVFVYLLAKRFMVPFAAALAALLFAISSYVVHFSRIGTGYNQATLFTVVVFYFLMRGVQEKRAWCITAAGFFAGVGLLSYQACKIIAPVAVLSVLLLMLFRALSFRNGFRIVVLFGLGVWITVAPLLGNFLKDPKAVSSRTNAVSVFHEDGRRYMRYNYPSDMTLKQILMEQFRRTTFAPITYNDNSPYLNNLQYGGMLDPLPALLFSAGLVCVLAMVWLPQGYLLPVWYLFLLYPASALTNGAPSYQRLVCLMPVLALMAAPVCSAVLTQMVHRMRMIPQIKPVVLVVVFFLIFMLGFHRYFYQIMAVPQLLDDHTRVARHLEKTGPTVYTYMFGRDRFSIRYGTIRFLAPKAKGMDVTHPENFVKTTVNRTGPIQFLFIGRDTEYVDEIKRLYPGGKLEYHYNRLDQSPFITYQVNR